MMVAERPNLSRTGKYPAAQAARALGVTKQTLLRWWHSGLFRPDECTVSTVGKRMLLFTGKGLLRLWDSNGNIK